MTVLWLTYPKFRWLYGTLVALVVIGLIGLDYHFVSDVIAGACLGGLTGYYVVKISNLNRNVRMLGLAVNNFFKRCLRLS
jgi:membrane-associated phospholipid phosphatase